MQALQRATSLAESSGKLATVVRLLTQAGMSALTSGDVRALLRLADQVLELALREGNPDSLLLAHSLQVHSRQFRGDLAGAERHFAAEMELAADPSVVSRK